MIAWTCNSFLFASDWAVQNNELMTVLTCHKTGHLTALSDRQGTQKVAGSTASFGILLAMIVDGSSCCLMFDDRATLDTNCYPWVGNICPVNFSIGRIEMCFLGLLVGDFERSDDDPMLLMVDLRC